jgi:hypothetical protein
MDELREPRRWREIPATGLGRMRLVALAYSVVGLWTIYRRW